MVDLPILNQTSNLDVPLDRDVFLRTLIRTLAGTLEEVVGLREASGYISVVGQNVGDQMNQDYKAAFQVSSLSRQQVAQVPLSSKGQRLVEVALNPPLEV